MIFPTLQNKKYGCVNLNDEGKQWLENKNITGTNPLLDPEICSQMIADVHKKYHFDFSYGGYLEDRSFLWKGSYLDKLQNYVHLGIDISVPVGTKVVAPFDAEVVRIENDYPLNHGWGTMVILRNKTEPIYLLCGHLDDKLLCSVGDILEKGQIFANIGRAPYNGNWFSHIHIQAIAADFYQEMEEKKTWNDLDGYCTAESREINAQRFPDPTKYFLA